MIAVQNPSPIESKICQIFDHIMFTGVEVAFDPSVITVNEGSVGSICAIITNGTIDRSVSITFNVLVNTGTASSPRE